MMKKERKEYIKFYENELMTLGNQVTGNHRKHYYL